MAASWVVSFFVITLLTIVLQVFGEWNSNEYLKREHSLTKPYTGSGVNVPLWDFFGSTMVTSSYIRLTSDHQSKAGSIWNSVPCRVRNWELHVHFKVHGSGKSLFGDGFVIWYTKERLQMGPVFGNRDYFTGLGIVADTYSNHNGPHNHQHPYISGMVNNGTLHYDHDRDGTHTELAGCESQFRNKDYDTYLAIRYELDSLKISMDVDGKGEWKECFTVSGVRLPVGYYFGASAATGQLADNHDIISMKVYELDVVEVKDSNDAYRGLPEADFFASPRDHVNDQKGGFMSGGSWSGWKIFFVIVLVLIGVAICASVGYVIFNKNDPSKRKRLY